MSHERDQRLLGTPSRLFESTPGKHRRHCNFTEATRTPLYLDAAVALATGPLESACLSRKTTPLQFHSPSFLGQGKTWKSWPSAGSPGGRSSRTPHSRNPGCASAEQDTRACMPDTRRRCASRLSNVPRKNNRTTPMKHESGTEPGYKTTTRKRATTSIRTIRQQVYALATHHRRFDAVASARKKVRHTQLIHRPCGYKSFPEQATN